MAITFVGQVAAASSSVTLPTHQVGDLIIIFAYRDITGAPSLPTGYTNISTQSANSNSFRIGYKVATSTSDSSGTWTLANQINAAIYRGASAVGGASSGTSATATAQTITGIGTMTVTDGTSWAVSYQGSRQTASTSTPAALTIRGTTSADATSGTSTTIWDSNAGVSSWGSHSNTLGTTAVTVSGSVELIATAAGTTGEAKVWNGSAFVAKPVKVWNGSTWVVKPLKRWSGSAWITTPY